jgi:hypothetical protein
VEKWKRLVWYRGGLVVNNIVKKAGKVGGKVGIYTNLVFGF